MWPFGVLLYVLVAVVLCVQAFEDEEDLHVPAILFTAALWAPMLLAAITLVAIDAAAARSRR